MRPTRRPRMSSRTWNGCSRPRRTGSRERNMAMGEITLAKSEPISWRRYYELTKPKVVMLILFTALVGMLLAAPGIVPWDTLVFGLLGIGLASAAGAVVNHVVDQHIDVIMERTRGRPLPSGRMDAPH